MIPKVIPNHTQDRWLAGADIRHAEVSIVPGALYKFHGMAGPKRADGTVGWLFPPGDYRCLGVGKNVRTFQELVAYLGEGGADDGKLLFCTLLDWVENFSPVAVPAPPGKTLTFTEGREGRDG